MGVAETLFAEQLFRKPGLANHRFERPWPNFIVHIVVGDRHKVSSRILVLSMAAVLPDNAELVPF